MDDKTKIILGVIVAVVLFLPVIGRLMPKTPTEEPAPQAAQSAPAAPVAQPAPAPPPPPPPSDRPVYIDQYGEPQYAEPEPAPVVAQPAPQPKGPQRQKPEKAPPVDPRMFENTTWLVEGATAYLLPGGRLVAQAPGVPMQIEGTWSVSNNSLSVSAMGRSFSAKIVDGQVVSKGRSIQRVR